MSGALYPLLARTFNQLTGPPSPPRRVLILKPCCLGDVVLATALAAAVRQALPSTHITFATGPWSTPVLLNNPHVDMVLTLEHDVPTPKTLPALARSLMSHGFDWCFVPDRSPLLGLAALLARIPVRVGLDAGGRAFACNVRIPASSARHEMHLYLDLARAVGLKADVTMPTYMPDSQSKAWSEHFLRIHGLAPKAIAILHPGGGENPGSEITSKRWPASNFAALADMLSTQGLKVLLAGGPSDVELNRAVTSATACKPLDLSGSISLAQLAALAAHAALYVGNDTGASHMAAAVGAPTIAIFGPTNPARYAPRGPMVRTLGGVAWDGDLRRQTPPPPVFPTLQEVWQACLEMLHAAETAPSTPDA